MQYGIAVKRQFRKTCPEDWAEKVRSVDGLEIIGDAQFGRLLVEGNDKAIKELEALLGDILHIEPLSHFQTQSEEQSETGAVSETQAAKSIKEKRTMGYKPGFLSGHTVPLPTPSARVQSHAFANGQFVHHSKHSLMFNQQRGFSICAAHNIDAALIGEDQLTNRSFKADPKILPKSIQVLNDQGYRNNPWDRGHLARRKSLSWGQTTEEIETAERESDFYSNIVPQHENLHDDAWGNIEDWMLDRIIDGAKKACVFTGPVLTPEDPSYQAPDEDPIQIPAGFWKVMVVEADGDIKSAAFLVWQRDYDSDVPLTFSPVLEQVRVTTIEIITGLSFHDLGRKDALLFAQTQTSERLSNIPLPSAVGELETVNDPAISANRSGIFSSSDIVF